MSAAVKLLERATALLGELDPCRLELLPDLVVALMERGDLERADKVLHEAIEATVVVGDRHLQSRLVIERAFSQLAASQADLDEVVAVAEGALPVFEDVGDEHGMARAWHLVGEAQLVASRWGAAAES